MTTFLERREDLDNNDQKFAQALRKRKLKSWETNNSNHTNTFFDSAHNVIAKAVYDNEHWTYKVFMSPIRQ